MRLLPQVKRNPDIFRLVPTTTGECIMSVAGTTDIMLYDAKIFYFETGALIETHFLNNDITATYFVNNDGSYAYASDNMSYDEASGECIKNYDTINVTVTDQGIRVMQYYDDIKVLDKNFAYHNAEVEHYMGV